MNVVLFISLFIIYCTLLNLYDNINNWLMVWNMIFYFSIQLGMSSSQLTFTHIFQRGRSTTNQVRVTAISSTELHPQPPASLLTTATSLASSGAAWRDAPLLPALPLRQEHPGALAKSSRLCAALWGSHWQGSFSTMVFNMFQAWNIWKQTDMRYNYDMEIYGVW